MNTVIPVIRFFKYEDQDNNKDHINTVLSTSQTNKQEPQIGIKIN